MAHVGIQRLSPCQRQDHSAQNGDANPWMDDEEIHTPCRIDRFQHFRRLHDAVHAQRAQHQKPDDHHWPEQHTDARRAVALNQKQPDQHDQCHGHDPVIKAIERQFQPFHRRQNRHRRGDHAVAIEQRSAEQAEHHHHHLQFGVFGRRPARQRHQRHNAALALVIGTQNKRHVLERNHPDQRPEDQRQHPEYRVMRDFYTVSALKHLFEGVQRAGADVAVNHPHCCNQQPDGLRSASGLGMTVCLTHPLLPETRHEVQH